MNRRAAMGVLILAIAIVLAALRDFLFVNLNYQLDHLEHLRPFSYAHSRFQAAVQGMNAGDLRSLKWIFAVVFTAANLALAIWTARVRTGDNRYRRVLVTGFAVVAGLALLSHFAAPMLPVLGPVSIMLLHTVQYPVVLLFVWLAGWRRGS